MGMPMGIYSGKPSMTCRKGVLNEYTNVRKGDGAFRDSNRRLLPRGNRRRSRHARGIGKQPLELGNPLPIIGMSGVLLDQLKHVVKPLVAKAHDDRIRGTAPKKRGKAGLIIRVH